MGTIQTQEWTALFGREDLLYSFRIIELTVPGIWNKRKRCRKKAHQCYARTPSPPRPKPVYKELSCLNIAQSAFCSNLVPFLYCSSDFMWPSAPILSPTAVLLEYVTWNHSLESRTRSRTSDVPIKAVCSSLFADHEAAVDAAVAPSHDEVDVALDLGADGPLAQPLVRPVVNGLAAPVYAALAVVRIFKVDMPQPPPLSNLGSFFFFFSWPLPLPSSFYPPPSPSSPPRLFFFLSASVSLLWHLPSGTHLSSTGFPPKYAILHRHCSTSRPPSSGADA